MTIRSILCLVIVTLVAGCGGGGGVKLCGTLIGKDPCKKDDDSSSQAPSTSAVAGSGPAPSTSTSRLAEATSVETVTLDTQANVPVLFELKPAEPESIVHTSWIMPQIGDLEFVGRPFTSVYQPPLDYTGMATFSIQVEKANGTHERTNVRVNVRPESHLSYPWACPDNPISDRATTHIAAHPAIPGALVALQRDGQGLTSARSRDGGVTWESGSPLPTIDVRALMFDIGSSADVYVETDVGTLVSHDGGINWSPGAGGAVRKAEQTWPLYQVSGNQLTRSDRADDPGYLVATHASTLLGFASDPGNPKRIYFQAADGLYVLFRDGTPGPDAQEGERLVAVQSAGVVSPNGLTVDSHGRIYTAAESGIHCQEGDAPFSPGAKNHVIDILMSESLANASIRVGPVDVATEATIWLRSIALSRGAPGSRRNLPVTIGERILMPGESSELFSALDLVQPGIYELAVVLRTESGIVAREHATLVVKSTVAQAVYYDVSLDVSPLDNPGGPTESITRYEAQVINSGPDPVADATLEIFLPKAALFRIVPGFEDRWDCILPRSSVAVHCTAIQTLSPSSGPVRMAFDVEGARNDEILLVANGAHPDRDPTNDVWQSSAALADLVVGSRSLLGDPEPGREIVLNVDVSNAGDNPVTPVVTGLLQLSSDRALAYTDWIVSAEGADCARPTRFCPVGDCADASTAPARYTCRFDSPLVTAETVSIRIGLTAGSEGETVTSSVVAEETWDAVGANNLTQVVVTAREPTSPPPAGSGSEATPRCAGLLVLITWGACLDW